MMELAEKNLNIAQFIQDVFQAKLHLNVLMEDALKIKHHAMIKMILKLSIAQLVLHYVKMVYAETIVLM